MEEANEVDAHSKGDGDRDGKGFSMIGRRLLS